MNKLTRKLLAGAAAASLLVGVASIAAADTLSRDGDSVATGNNVTVSGAKCNLASSTSNGTATLNYQGSQHFLNGEDVTLSSAVDAAGTTAGITVSNNEVRALTGWDDTSDTSVFNISATVPQSALDGAYVVTVSVAGSRLVGGGGPNQNDVVAYSVSNTYTITVDCGRVATPSDTTAPDITIDEPDDEDVYLLGESVLADYSCVDNESTVTQCDGPVADGAAIDTSSVGAKTFKVDATSAGGSSSLTNDYYVHYGFTGFSAPVDNNGIRNKAKAGQAIPLKFRVTNGAGVGITTLTAPPVTVSVQHLDCGLTTTTDVVEEYAGNSGLQNLGDGYYQYNWKTPTTYARSCKTMTLNLGDGNTTHTALFEFTK